MTFTEIVTPDLVISIATLGSTVFSYLGIRRQNNRSEAKQAILMLANDDQMRWELYKEIPKNWKDIQDEYEKYHKAGGNGMITKRVQDYNAWYNEVQKELAKKGAKHNG